MHDPDLRHLLSSEPIHIQRPKPCHILKQDLITFSKTDCGYDLIPKPNTTLIPDYEYIKCPNSNHTMNFEFIHRLIND